MTPNPAFGELLSLSLDPCSFDKELGNIVQCGEYHYLGKANKDKSIIGREIQQVRITHLDTYQES